MTDFRALCAKVLAYNEGRDNYNFSHLKDYDRDNEAFDAWQEIKAELKSALAEPEPEGLTHRITPDDFRRWWRETGSASPAPSPEMLLTANAWAEYCLARWGRPTPQVTPEISDGYHTFAELYEHRHSLMLALMHSLSSLSWFSRRHADGELPFGDNKWFIVGIQLPTGPITYHLPIRLFDLARKTGAQELETGRPWDGHTADEVVSRLLAWASSPTPQPADGEVAELVDWLYTMRELAGEHNPDEQRNYTRAADLLERLSPPQPVPVLPEGTPVIEPTEHTLLVPVAQPIPVSERLPAAGDCDAEGMCWLWDGERRWVRQFRDAASSNTWTGSYWLPAHALPIPRSEND
jgi:hypothetical protein